PGAPTHSGTQRVNDTWCTYTQQLPPHSMPFTPPSSSLFHSLSLYPSIPHTAAPSTLNAIYSSILISLSFSLSPSLPLSTAALNSMAFSLSSLSLSLSPCLFSLKHPSQIHK